MPPRPAARAVGLAAALVPALLQAQTGPAAAAAADPLPPTIEACYVPASGTIYRINTAASPAPGAPNGCLSPTHVRFAWSQQGPKGDKGDRGEPGPAGTATVGPDLQLPGTLGVGGTSTLGGGLTLQTPAGFTPTAPLLLLRDAPVGGAQVFSVTPGGFLATRSLSVSGSASVANALTVGAGGATVAGPLAAAGSAALGPRGAVNGRTGAFAFGDNSTTTPMSADADNQFVVRAAGGVKLRTAADRSKGCDVDGAGTLTCTGGLVAAGAIGSLGTVGAVAAGPGSAALNTGAVALGRGAVARGEGSLALGSGVESTVPRAAAFGSAVVAGGEGSFVFGDASTSSPTFTNTPNEFLVRAAGGVRLRTAADLSKGCDVSTQGRLACTGGVSIAGALSVVRLAGPSAVIRAPGQDYVRATCPAGSTLLGGYVETDGADAIVPFASFDPTSAETFRAFIRNEGPVAINARVSITCLRVEP